MNTSLELLRRIDEKDYLTEREHREFLERLNKDLEILEILKKHYSMYESIYKGKALVLDYISEENDKKIKEWLKDGNII